MKSLVEVVVDLERSDESLLGDYGVHLSDDGALVPTVKEEASAGPIATQRTTMQSVLDRRTDNLPISLHKWVKLEAADSLLARLVASTTIHRVARLLVPVLFLAYLTTRLFKDASIGSAHFFRRGAVLVSVFLIFHVAVALLVWQAEYHADTLRPETPLATGNIWTAGDWILHYLITNESKYELRSFLSLGWLALLRGGYALSAIVVTYSTLGFLAATVRDVWIDQHIVVVGWNRRARHLVEELKRLKHEFVVVLPAADTQVDVELSKDLVIRRDDLRSGLAASQAAYARAIIVLANEAPEGDSADHADLWVARTTIEIKRFLSKAVKTDQETARVGDGQRDQDDNDAPRILVEINDHRHKEMLESLKVNRVVCVSDFGIELLAQAAAKDSVLVDVHSELLNTTHTTHEFYFVKISAEEAAAAQRRYDGLARLAIESSDVLVVGLVQATSSGQRVARIAPFGASLRAGDQAILLAKEQPTRILRIRDAEQ